MDAKYNLAMKLVAGGMSRRNAAKRVGVARESLRRRVNRLVQTGCKPGPQLRYLTEGAEIGLLKIVRFRAMRGMCIDKAELAFLIREAAIKNSATPNNKSHPPGTFADENFSGGILLTHAVMVASMRKKEEYKMYAAAAKASKSLEANERATMNMHDKPKHYTTNTRKNIRAATPKRPRVAKTANAKRPKYMDVVVV